MRSPGFFRFLAFSRAFLRGSMTSALSKFSAGLLILLGLPAASLAQLPGVTPLGSPPRITASGGYGSIMIYLRTEDGQKLPDEALPTFTISSTSSSFQLTNQPQRTGDGWAITGLAVGNDYEIQVRAIGYRVALEDVEIPDLSGAVSSVIIFMKSVDQALVFRPPTGGFVLAPKAQKEVQHALQDLQQGKIPSAQKHMEKALQLAPGNPYVQYVMGMTYFLSNQLDRAKPYLERSVSIDPKQPAALMALGALRFQQGEDQAAIQVLTKAVQFDGTSWKAEWYLACSYLRQKQFEESRAHAEQALKLGKEKARLAEIVLGEAQANLGQSEKAAATFETFAKENPQNPNAKDALRWADMLRHPPPPRPKPAEKTVEGVSYASEELSMGLPLPPSIEVPPRDWAPPDVDAEKPFVISGATCPLTEILKSAETNALTLVATLQEFSATEDFQAVEEKKSGALERPASKTFNYYVFIEQPGPGLVTVREVRDDIEGADALLGRVADAGAPSLALVFHPAFQKDFDWKCEGMGKWNDRSAWIMHFTQDTSRTTSGLTTFGTSSKTYPLPLKGRAWLSENGGQVLHLETDLVEPMAPLDLRRVHFAIDYQLVSFRTHQTELWLPENVDTYIQYRGHFLHHYHHYSNFKLFWVGATQKIGDPKEAQKMTDPAKPQEQ
jgi:tetratricopeptide (TPR) repeat protein